MAIVSTVQKEPRFIDPESTPEKQVSNLKSLIKDPPQNSRILTVTPELAQWVLENLNNNNRRHRPAKIKAWSEVMRCGGWILTGDTLKFGRSGMLLDGQNRLKACLRSGVAFKTYVAFGIEDRAFDVIDTNSVRTNSDTFQIAGVEYHRIVAPAVRWLMIYENDPMDRGLSFDNATLYSYYRASIDAEQMGRAARHAVAVSGLSQGALAAHLYMFYRVNVKATKAFATDLEGYLRGGRKLIDKIALLRKQAMGRLHEVQVNALTIIAWQAYRNGETVTAATLKWTESNDYPSIG